MAKLAKEILEEALALPPADRAALADSLLESLDDDAAGGPALSQEEWLDHWTEVAKKRAADLDAGKTQAIPWTEARERLKCRLDE